MKATALFAALAATAAAQDIIERSQPRTSALHEIAGELRDTAVKPAIQEMKATIKDWKSMLKEALLNPDALRQFVKDLIKQVSTRLVSDPLSLFLQAHPSLASVLKFYITTATDSQQFDMHQLEKLIDQSSSSDHADMISEFALDLANSGTPIQLALQKAAESPKFQNIAGKWVDKISLADELKPILDSEALDILPSATVSAAGTSVDSPEGKTQKKIQEWSDKILGVIEKAEGKDVLTEQEQKILRWLKSFDEKKELAYKKVLAAQKALDKAEKTIEKIKGKLDKQKDRAIIRTAKKIVAKMEHYIKYLKEKIDKGVELKKQFDEIETEIHDALQKNVNELLQESQAAK